MHSTMQHLSQRRMAGLRRCGTIIADITSHHLSFPQHKIQAERLGLGLCNVTARKLGNGSGLP